MAFHFETSQWYGGFSACGTGVSAWVYEGRECASWGGKKILACLKEGNIRVTVHVHIQDIRQYWPFTLLDSRYSQIYTMVLGMKLYPLEIIFDEITRETQIAGCMTGGSTLNKRGYVRAMLHLLFMNKRRTVCLLYTRF
jgi:hypothetical protein